VKQDFAAEDDVCLGQCIIDRIQAVEMPGRRSKSDFVRADDGLNDVDSDIFGAKVHVLHPGEIATTNVEQGSGPELGEECGQLISELLRRVQLRART